MTIELIWHELKTYVASLNKKSINAPGSKSKLTKLDFVANIKDFWENNLTPEK